ncbi:MAG: hypothetical protein ACFFDF_08630 [Candidatus Odinarchaeota archaeon]
MEYDIGGLPLALRGKRRSRTPKTVKCFECGKDVPKVSYGTYECEKCRKVYQFKYGKLVQGDIEYMYSIMKKKSERCYLFPLVDELD